jgi:hypothetical protein
MHETDRSDRGERTRHDLGRRGFLAAAAATAFASSTVLTARPALAAVRLGEMSADVTSVEEAKEQAEATAWGGHSNGRIPASALSPVLSSVPGSGYLRRDAAAQYVSMALAFRAAIGTDLGITEGYRSYDRQVEYWNRYQQGTGNLAAYPGTSNHGWGVSCDFGSGVQSYGTAAKRWMDANAARYGWEPTGNGFSSREAWHFDFVRPWTGGPAQANPLELFLLRCTDRLPSVGSGYVALVGLRRLRHMETVSMITSMRSLGVPYFEVGATRFTDALAGLSIPLDAVRGGASHIG